MRDGKPQAGGLTLGGWALSQGSCVSLDVT